ncbi:hypothetical protein ES705_28903 [subsurface metagenome]
MALTSGNKQKWRQGDKGTGRQGDKETRGQGETEKKEVLKLGSWEDGKRGDGIKNGE